MSGSIRQCFLNVSMGNRHHGLQEIARRSGINLSSLTPDSYLVFVNSARDKIAMLVGPQTQKTLQTMAYVRLERGRKVDLRIIKEIPRCFQGRSLNYDEALKLAIDKALAKKSESIEAVL